MYIHTVYQLCTFLNTYNYRYTSTAQIYACKYICILLINTYKYKLSSFCVEPCGVNTCLNGGTCNPIVINNQLTFSCACVPGYTGFTCQVDIDDCEPDPCRNGGTCMDMLNGFLCQCTDEWGGDTCEQDVDECLPDPCMNGGTCVNLPGGYSCSCIDEWEGNNCQNTSSHQED